jgi:hypothetical protein
MTIETDFKKWLLAKVPTLNESRITRKGSGERKSHLRFYNGCGIGQVTELTSMLDSCSLSYISNDNYTGSPTYKGHGFDVSWNGKTVGVLLGVARAGNIERKKYSPKNLNLAGKTFNNITAFRNDVVKSLTQVEADVGIRDCLISMLDNIESGTAVTKHAFLKNNLNKVTSDFGEVLGAFISVKKGNSVFFPETSNNNIADFYENNLPVSAKGRKAGNTLNLGSYKDLIPKTTNTEKFLYSLATHNKDLFFEMGANLCPEAKLIASWVGGTSEAKVKAYIKKTSFDQFYDKIKSNDSFKGLGIPLESKNDRPKDFWDEGSTDPFYFTVNTIINRLWGRVHTAEITSVINGLNANVKFLHIDLVGVNITATEVPFVSIEQWGTHYWSRATKAFHNWMAVQSIEAKND